MLKGKEETKENIMDLFKATFTIATVLYLIVLIFIRDKPATPPSPITGV
jgi:hypothetical protein